MDIAINTLEAFLEHRFGYLGSLKKVYGGLSHDMFLLETKEQEYMVKVYSETIDLERLHLEERALKIIENSSDISAPKLIRSLRGNLREDFSGRKVSFYKKIPGQKKYNLTEGPKNSSEISAIAHYLAKLHNSVRIAKEESSTNSNFKSGVINWFKIIDANSLPALLKIEEELREIEAEVIIIHGDFQHSNILYQEDDITGIVDFEYANYDYRIVEIAMTTSNLLSVNLGMDFQEILTVFVDEYNSLSTSRILSLEHKLLERLIRFSWKLNLFWGEEQLKTLPEEKSEERKIIELFCLQSKICLQSKTALQMELTPISS